MGDIEVRTCSLIGPNHEELRTEIEKKKKKFLGDNSERRFVVEIDLEKEKDDLMEAAYAQRMWKLWSKIVKMFSELVPGEKYQEEYNYFSQNAVFKDIVAERKISNLLTKYEENGILLLLIMSRFESARQIFPREHTNEMFFRRLFTLTSKSLSKKKCLRIVLASTERIGGKQGIAHNMGAGSDIEAAYPVVKL